MPNKSNWINRAVCSLIVAILAVYLIVIGDAILGKDLVTLLIGSAALFMSLVCIILGKFWELWR